MGYAALLPTPMIEAGYYGQVLNKMRQLYGPFIKRGEPTRGERASEVYENTAHRWGAAANTLIAEGLVGLKPLEPGWKSFALQPAEGFTADFSYTLPLPGGTLEVVRRDGKLSASWPEETLLVRGKKVRTGSGKLVELG